MTDQQNAALEPCPFCGAATDHKPNCIWVKAALVEAHPEHDPWPLNAEMRIRALEQATRPAPAGAEAVREAAEAGYRLSTWAACVRWDGGRNEKDWLDGLRERIEKVQALAALRAKPEAPTEKGK